MFKIPSRMIVLSLCLVLSSLSAASSQTIQQRYGVIAQRLISASMASDTAWNRLAYITDTFGPRLSGSTNLEKAIDRTVEMMKADGFDTVYTESVKVPHWVRGKESLQMISPRPRSLPMLGLGGSIGTPIEGITAEVIVVDELDSVATLGARAKGKIVLINQAFEDGRGPAPFRGYSQTVRIRSQGAIEAAKVGAIACIIRSVGPYGMQTPHTGSMAYMDGVAKIPAAAITIEDADMIERMVNRGQSVVLTLKMEAQTLPDADSRNIIVELRGYEKPEEVVVMGGHFDSWDVGTGAMDDAGGCIVSWEAIRLMKQLGLRPRRTIRVVFWTNEENGLRGAQVYKNNRENEVKNHVLAIESDAGVFKPLGYGFTGVNDAYAIIREIGQLLQPIEAGTITRGGGGADIAPLTREGVPSMGLTVDGSKYFWYHHTDADTIDKLNKEDVNKCVASMALMSFIVADMVERLPWQATIEE
jgi:carboxypeptidase Q